MVRDEQAERVAGVFEKKLNIKRDLDMELLEHIKDEEERVTENPDAKKVLDNKPRKHADHQGNSESDRAIGRTSAEKAAGGNGIPRSSTRRWLPARRVSSRSRK